MCVLLCVYSLALHCVFREGNSECWLHPHNISVLQWHILAEQPRTFKFLFIYNYIFYLFIIIYYNYNFPLF